MSRLLNDANVISISAPSTRSEAMTEMLNRRIVITTEVNISAALATIDSAECAAAVEPPAAPVPFKMKPEEALFFDCLLDALAEHGINPPAMLRLPASIGKVVDYEHVKALVMQRMFNCEYDTPDAFLRHRERVKASLKRSRDTLQAFCVIGTDYPYIYWTGKIVAGRERLSTVA